MRVFRYVVVCLVAGGLSPLAGQAPKATREWKIDTLADVPAGEVIRWPVLSVVGDTLLIAGNVFPLGRAAVHPRTRSILRVPGRALSLPEGDFTFAYPRLLTTRDGAYHLIWAEFTDSVARHSWWRAAPNALWYSQFTKNGWSRPIEIYRAFQLEWGPNQRPAAVDGKGRLHVLVPATVRPGHVALVYLRDANHRWAAKEIGGMAAYADIAAVGHDSLVAVIVAPDPNASRDANSVLTIASADAGHTWRSPRLLSPSRGLPAYDPRIAAYGGTIHLLWRQRESPTSHTEQLRHWVTRDGTVWKPLAVVPLPGRQTVHVELLTAPCGRSIGLVEALATSPSGLHVVVDEVSWTRDGTATERLLPQFAGTANMGAALHADTLALVLTAADAIGTRVVLAKTPVCMHAAQ